MTPPIEEAKEFLRVACLPDSTARDNMLGVIIRSFMFMPYGEQKEFLLYVANKLGGKEDLIKLATSKKF